MEQHVAEAGGAAAGAAPGPVVELLVVPGCPNGEPYLPELLRLVEPAGAQVRVRVVNNEDQARRWAFPGSPTVRVDGVDVDHDAALPVAMSCRLYRSADGVSGRPPRARVLDAVTEAAAAGGVGVPDAR